MHQNTRFQTNSTQAEKNKLKQSYCLNGIGVQVQEKKHCVLMATKKNADGENGTQRG